MPGDGSPEHRWRPRQILTGRGRHRDRGSAARYWRSAWTRVARLGLGAHGAAAGRGLRNRLLSTGCAPSRRAVDWNEGAGVTERGVIGVRRGALDATDAGAAGQDRETYLNERLDLVVADGGFAGCPPGARASSPRPAPLPAPHSAKGFS
ncbi:hypothetical protein GCM10009665_10500 [Kitasatospora nipponensis]|uniref:Uncharacterized protein n=1 Tax=Kitasatospora nipponensis TaxID=258049 RepID=A0ABP4GE06_9ACTN